MAASIELRFQQSNDDTVRQSYDMLVEVMSATDVSEEIFVFQREVAPAQTVGEDPTDIFTSVADPLDLEEYPPGPPGDAAIPYYRQSTVSLRFRSYTDLLDTKEYIISDVQGLVNAINKALINPVDQTITIS